MTAIGTLPVLFATGIHSARPAASAVGKGGLYSCTTHSLVYQTDGSSWTTWATVGGGFTDPMTTRGDVIVRNASNVTARLPIGSTGKVLQSDGTDISWQTPAGGGGSVVLLEQHTASSSASLDFTTCISSTYDEYLIEFVGIVPATNSVAFWMRMGTGGGPTYDTGANYGWSGYVMRAGGAAPTGAESGATKIQIGFSTDLSNGATRGVDGTFRLFDPQTTARHKRVLGQTFSYDVSGFNLYNSCNGVYQSTTAVTAFQFLMSSGNIASGTIRVYGIAK